MQFPTSGSRRVVKTSFLSAFPGALHRPAKWSKGTQKVLIAAKLGKAELQLAGDHPPADKFPLGV
ncbi:unnamed protein product, partial [Strongylus vulgaris]